MYEFSGMTERVKKVRALYRNTVPYLDTHRYRIVTEFYQNNRNLHGNLKRALNFKNLCEKIPCFLRDEDLIAGEYTASYKASALYPEYSIAWIVPELESGLLSTREDDPYQITEEDKQYILDTYQFWDDECLDSLVNPYIPEAYQKIAKNAVLNFTAQDICPQPIGHFAPNYMPVVHKGFKAIKEEADAKMEQLLADGLPGGSAKYNFYWGISIVCEGLITYAKRYSAECAKQAAVCEDPVRKAELTQMSEIMDHVIEYPARNFREAVQAVWFYQMSMLMDANMHGASVGRIDQVLGPFAEADLASGAITREEAQELIDLYYLKVAECNKVWGARNSKASPGYTSGQLITLGGVDKDGNDATNAVTYMCLEAMGRMKMHSPSQALRLHKGTPHKLWECALAVNKIAGGVPSFYSDDLVRKALESRGIAKEDTWNYGLIGCVEPSIGGDEWPACGGVGINSYTNFVNILVEAINNGRTYLASGPFAEPETQFGPKTGYLYDMKSIEEVKEAYLKTMEYWIRWDAALINIHEEVTRHFIPQPVVSATKTGCMESGLDVMDGGSKYNSTGMSGIGLGNVAESLHVINELCFKQKKCTTRELYDAVVNNWVGYEDLRNYIIGELAHYGNNNADADEFVSFVADSYADYVVKMSTYRGRYAPGMYPVTMNVVFGKFTPATPDSRKSGEPLSDGISAVQGFDTSGPTSILNSVTKFDHSKYSNGILLNMKIHPTAVSNDEGVDKLIALMKTYFFSMGGMEMQLNIVSAETLKDAQEHPDNYKDLVVRIAGFSAYFVETYKDAQDDLIRRTELGL